MKAILYSRVSTKEQVKGISLEAQDGIILARAKADGYKDIQFIQDAGLGAGNLNRIGIQSIIEQIKNRKKGDLFNVVYVYNLKRISRDVEDLCFLMKLGRKKGVKIIAISEGIDLTDENQEMNAQIHGVMAQNERKGTGKVTKFVLNHLKDNDRVYAKVPYGFDATRGELIDGRIRNRQLFINEKETDIVKRVYELKENKGARAIATALNKETKPREGAKFYPSSIYRILSNEQLYKRHGIIQD